jgi:hypothetical protein
VIAIVVYSWLIPPLSDKFSVEDENVGEGVEEKNDVVFSCLMDTLLRRSTGISKV